MPAAIGAAMAMMLRTMESCVRSFILASKRRRSAKTRADSAIPRRKRPEKRRPRIPWRRGAAWRSAGSKRVRYARLVNASSDPRPTPRRKVRQIVSAAIVAAAGLCLVGLALAGPRPFRAFPGVEHDGNDNLPPDYMVPAEWTFARLMYPTCHSYRMRGCYRGEGDSWKGGG